MSENIHTTISSPPVRTRVAQVAIPADLLADAAIEDHRVFLPHATWDDFERVLAMRGDSAAMRAYRAALCEMVLGEAHP